MIPMVFKAGAARGATGTIDARDHAFTTLK
jgi:hypothetical protein